ncbi:MAG: radical SAM protein, partial [Ilumatobacteraceae bacterium]
MTAPAPPLEQLQLLLTERCNLRCTHCAVPEEDSPASGELTTGEWTTFIDEVLRSGVRRIVLSGGEALLRRDCLTIAEHALVAGADAVVIVTNGTVLPVTTVERLADLQRSWPSLLLHVSLDGCSETTHDMIRGAGSYVRTMAGLDRLIAAGGRADGVHTVVNQANLHELEQIADLARRLGATSWTVFPVAALGRGADLDAIRLGDRAWSWLIARFANSPPRGLDLGLMGPTIVDEWSDRFSVPMPRAEHSPQACVGPDGAVFTCPPLRHVEAGNAVDIARELSWQTADNLLRVTMEDACPTCKYRSLCTGVDPGAPPLVIAAGAGEPRIKG